MKQVKIGSRTCLTMNIESLLKNVQDTIVARGTKYTLDYAKQLGKPSKIVQI